MEDVQELFLIIWLLFGIVLAVRSSWKRSGVLRNPRQQRIEINPISQGLTMRNGHLKTKKTHKEKYFTHYSNECYLGRLTYRMLRKLPVLILFSVIGHNDESD